MSPALPAPFSLLHPHWLLPYTCSQVGSPPHNGAMDGGGWSRGYGRRVWLSMHAFRELAASPAIQFEIGAARFIRLWDEEDMEDKIIIIIIVL